MSAQHLGDRRGSPGGRSGAEERLFRALRPGFHPGLRREYFHHGLLAVSVCLVWLSLEGVASGQDRVINMVRAGVLTTQMLDVGTTLYGTGAGVVREANPALRWAAEEPFALVPVKLGTTAFFDWSIRRLAKKNRTAAICLGVGLTASSAYVAMHNMREIRRAQR